jgi:hypothetical protein
MVKKKWLSRHSDGRHFPVEYPDKDNLPKGSLKEIAVDEAIDSEHELTGEEYAQELYPEEYGELTEREMEDREIINEIESEKEVKDEHSLGGRVENRVKDIGQDVVERGIEAEEKGTEIGNKLKREIRKFILKRQLKEIEDNV